MESLLLVALVALCALCNGAKNFITVPIGFGNTNDPEVKALILDPCVTLKPVPKNAGQCGGYKMCENNTMVSYECPRGTGFSAWTGQCDIDCNDRKRRLIKKECGPSPRGVRRWQINETVVYGDGNVPVMEGHDIPCPAASSYQVMGKCGCDPYNVTVKPCETVSVMHFSSSDNSWELAKNNTPLNGGASLTGDGEVVSPESRMFRRSGFFKGGSRFVSQRLNGNDLGLYFDLSFTFQAVEDDNSNGVTITSNDKVPVFIALADNSADEQEATYGCMLRVEQTNRGKVVCYVRPSKANRMGKAPDGNGRDDVTVDSPEVDLTKRISVQFVKDNTEGRLTVTAEGSREQVTPVRFPRGVRAIGQTSPWIIADGTGKRPFRGYMDDMDLRKHCGHFMSATPSNGSQ